MDRVEAICDLLIERGIRKRYGINARTEMARRPDVVMKMARVGFAILLIGLESAQDKTLKLLRKGFNTKQARERFAVLRRSGMILHGFFIVGNIGESEQEMLQILPFARKLGLDTLQAFVLRDEPFSGIGELVSRTPGYHVARCSKTYGGEIYSDRYSVRHLGRLRSRINRRFYRFTGCQQLHQL